MRDSTLTATPTHRTPNIGARVRIVRTLSGPGPLPVGREGTVEWIGHWGNERNRQIGVRWDDGRHIVLLPGDPFRVITD